QIVVENRVCRRPQLVPVKVHEKEGKIIKGVDGGNGLIELDRVVKGGPASPQYDVGEVQITMTSAHEATVGALFQRGSGHADPLAQSPGEQGQFWAGNCRLAKGR